MKKFSWILALLAALTMVFVGVGCGGGDDGPVDVADLVIDDADEIGDLLTAVNLYGGEVLGAGDGAPVVKTDKNKAIFKFASGQSVNNYGFQFDFPAEGVEKAHKFVDVTFKVVSITTLTGTGTAKIGFKDGANNDLKPYDDFEIVFGKVADLDTIKTKEFTQKFPKAMLTKDAFKFTHNAYGPTPDPDLVTGSQPPIEYTLEITKVKFYSGSDVVVSVLDIGNIAPAAGATADTEIEGVQFTGAITWTPAIVDGKFAAATDYTAAIKLTAKSGFTLTGLTADAEFEAAGATTVTYAPATTTVTAVYPKTGIIENYSGTKLKVTAGAGTIETTVKGEGDTDKEADVGILDNETGYKVVYNGGYGTSYATFEIDFDDGTLADYKELTLTFQGISGDVGWKDLQLLASDTAITGDINSTQGSLTVDKVNYNNAGTTAALFTFDLTKATALQGESKVTFSVYLQCKTPGDDNKPTTFIVSDIEFVEAE